MVRFPVCTPHSDSKAEGQHERIWVNGKVGIKEVRKLMQLDSMGFWSKFLRLSLLIATITY